MTTHYQRTQRHYPRRVYVPPPRPEPMTVKARADWGTILFAVGFVSALIWLAWTIVPQVVVP